MALTPLGDRILIRRTEEDEQTTSGGIIIPDTAKEKPKRAKSSLLGKVACLTMVTGNPLTLQLKTKSCLGNTLVLK